MGATRTTRTGTSNEARNQTQAQPVAPVVAGPGDHGDEARPRRRAQARREQGHPAARVLHQDEGREAVVSQGREVPLAGLGGRNGGVQGVEGGFVVHGGTS